MAWSLFEKRSREGVERHEELKPKIFSSGKSQEAIVDEVVKEINNKRKIIFIHGTCGTGKSAIALNIARELGKASVIVPIKNLQRQYEGDYMDKKFLLKQNKDKMKINMITGRANHKCLYLQENKKEILETAIKEKNANLFDIFENREEKKDKLKEDESCNNYLLPCKIEIKQKNLRTLKKYYLENPERKNNKDLDLKNARRLAIAPACPYWCPILKEDSKIKLEGKKKKYKSISGESFILVRKEGCPYYKQFEHYADSDVIIFNSDSYILETGLGRKPLTEVEIIDECDEFLDSFAVEGSINITRLRNELILFDSEDERDRIVLKEVINELDELEFKAQKTLKENTISNEAIMHINEAGAEEIIKSLVNNDIFQENRDDESYLEHCLEVARDFYSILEDVYVSFSKDKKGDVYLKLVTVNLEKRLGGIIEKNKAFVFMSGTIHSSRVLEEIFGLKDFKIIEAETLNQGTITRKKTGLEKDFSYDNFRNGRVTREEYLKALDKCVEASEKPTLIHLSAFQDLPNYDEKTRFNLKNLITSEELIEMQNKDKEGKLVRDFKAGKIKVLFTTRCNRGIDFPYSTCNSVVISRFPYPNIQGLFWRILKKNKPSFFCDFYKDKAHRELLQRIYRSVRASDDHVFLLSPDLRVLESKIV